MKNRVFLTVVLLCLSFAPNAIAQTKKNISPVPFNAFFSGETGKSPKLKRPTEETFGIWNEYSSKEHGFTVSFPARAGEIWTDERDKIASFETETAKAHYSVMRMSFPSILDNRQLNILGESLFSGSLDEKTTKLINEKNVCLDGIAGKELIYEEAGKIFFTRFYILNQKMFMLSVSLPKTEYTSDFDYWAMKFLDSFGAEASGKHIG